ncbi:ArnT family glycosyltransferase [Ktedonosporobacter rubrisoli]|nr:glycosyltransferase family 39 protein [Ktedonosporobacter rubrisoli]
MKQQQRLPFMALVPAVGIFVFAFVVRAAYNVLGAKDYYPLHDSATYQSIAFNILHEHCYCLHSQLPTVDRAPLWPAIIAAIYGALGSQDHYVRFFLCVVGAATCLLIYFFAKDLFGKGIGILAGLIGTIYPFLFIYDAWLYTESLYIFLLLALCYTLYRLQIKPHWGLMALSGVLIALLAFTRPNGLALLPVFLVWIFIMWRTKMLPGTQVIKGAIIVSVVSLALIAPWTIRNYTVTHALIPLAVGDGKVLLGAYNDQTADPTYQNGRYLGIWIIPDESTPAIAQKFPSKDLCSGPCEVQRDNTYRYYAEQWMQTHLDKMPYMLGLHFVNTWQATSQEADLPINRFPDRPISKFVVMLMEIITPIVLILAACGLAATWKRWRYLLFIYFLILMTVAQSIVLYGIPRFRAPLEPMFIILAAGAIWWLTGWLNKRRPALQNASVRQEKTPISVSAQRQK